MIDIHTHILPGVDDGAGNIGVSLEIAREAEKQGIKTIVATPHYMENRYKLSRTETEKRVSELQKAIDRKGIDIKILAGAEVYITADLGKKMKKGLISTVNNTRYVLVETPLSHIPDYTDSVLYDLKVMGYIPVMCHPERYQAIMEDPNILLDWLKGGIYAQLDAGSLLNHFGHEVRETAELLVRHNLVQFIGSDVHSTGLRRECLADGVEVLREICGDYAEQYLINAELMIEDKEIQYREPVYYRKKPGLLGKLKKVLAG
jgi:protein-tyrosine phosphatase